MISNIKSVDDNIVLFMADNLYIAGLLNGKISWISLDGAKMEASHTLDDADDYIRMILQNYESIPNYMTELYSWLAKNLIVESMVVLGNVSFALP